MKTSAVIDFIEYLRSHLHHVHLVRVELFFRSLACVENLGTLDIYWAGRLAFCGSESDIITYDACFALFFDDETHARSKHDSPHEPDSRPGGSSRAADLQPDAKQHESRLIARATEIERLRHADMSTLDEERRRQVYSLIAAIRTKPPIRRSRRQVDAAKGVLHAGRTARSNLKWLGEIGDLRFVAPRLKPRRCVLLLDISGSMRDYAEALMLYGYSLVASMPGTVEVFAMGTRLTRLTPMFKRVSLERAQANAAQVIRDWHGGTRLGVSLKRFLSEWGERGMVRGTMMIIASDGWESGEAQTLAEQMARLKRLCYCTIWVNPHKTSPGYEPTAAGMRSALPHVDEFLGGASLHELSRVSDVIRTRCAVVR